MPDEGMIKLDSEFGKEIGFVSSKFNGWLWLKDGAVIISFIGSKKKGNFRQLVDAIRVKGLRVDIPTPIGRMQDIVLKNGYRHHIVNDEDMGLVDVWSLE